MLIFVKMQNCIKQQVDTCLSVQNNQIYAISPLALRA